ncbi:hypothetical protein BDN71DRAFT_1391045, partial [Pleurotus eryngii]
HPDVDTGLWVVRPEVQGPHNDPLILVVHLDSIYHVAHLLSVFSPDPILLWFKHSYAFNAFMAFYLNKYIDYHSFKFLS